MDLIDDAETTKPRHPIGVVSLRTGVRQEVLRAWERRYGAVVPHRTGTGRRLYSAEDLERVRLLRCLVTAGWRISDVANLPAAQLEAMVEEDRAARRQTPTERPGSEAGRFVVEGLEAVRNLDEDRLREILAEGSLAMSPYALRQDVLTPLLKQTGELWRNGSFRIVNEHLATSVVRSFLQTFQTGQPVDPRMPLLLIATPAGHRHEIGALLVAATASEVGWKPAYVGADLPAEEIAAAARTRRARAIALSLVYAPLSRALDKELRRLRRLVAETPILIGGPLVQDHVDTLREIGAHVVRDLSELGDLLDQLVDPGTR